MSGFFLGTLVTFGLVWTKTLISSVLSNTPCIFAIASDLLYSLGREIFLESSSSKLSASTSVITFNPREVFSYALIPITTTGGTSNTVTGVKTSIPLVGEFLSESVTNA